MAGTAAGAAKARQKRTAGVQAPEQVNPVEMTPGVAIGLDEADPKAAADRRLARRFGRPRGGLLEPTHYVVTRRPLKWEGLELLVGEEVPGAAQWARLDAWVRAGRIAPAYGEPMTMTSAQQEPVEAGEPEELEENVQTAPEDDDPTQFTGEPLEEGDEPVVEVSK